MFGSFWKEATNESITELSLFLCETLFGAEASLKNFIEEGIRYFQVWITPQFTVEHILYLIYWEDVHSNISPEMV